MSHRHVDEPLVGSRWDRRDREAARLGDRLGNTTAGERASAKNSMGRNAVVDLVGDPW